MATATKNEEVESDFKKPPFYAFFPSAFIALFLSMWFISQLPAENETTRSWGGEQKKKRNRKKEEKLN